MLDPGWNHGGSGPGSIPIDPVPEMDPDWRQNLLLVSRSRTEIRYRVHLYNWIKELKQTFLIIQVGLSNGIWWKLYRFSNTNIIIKTCLRCFGHLQQRTTFPMGPSAPIQLPASVGNDLGKKRKTNIIFRAGPSAHNWQNYWLYMMIVVVIVFTEFWYCQCWTYRETSNLDAGPQDSL